MEQKKKFVEKGVETGKRADTRPAPTISDRKEKGITLIALVITIIVLLILAGVTIAMVVGDNGILTRAKEAKESTRGGDVKEVVDLAVAENAMADQTGGNKNTKDSVIEKLKKDGKLTDKEVETLKENDQITIGSILVDFSKLNGSGGEGLTADEITVENYGAYVNYNVDIDNDTTDNDQEEWRIFYANNNRIFLIAADCVDNNSSALSAALSQCTELLQNGDNQYTWSGKIEEMAYECIEDKCTFPSLFEFTNYKPANHSDNTNSKCVSELLCTTKWKSFLDQSDGSGFGEYAIGSPTLEMWVDSWNKHDDKYTKLYLKTNENGYYIGTKENTNDYYITGLLSDDTLYFPHHIYWFASTNAYSTESMMR